MGVAWNRWQCSCECRSNSVGLPTVTLQLSQILTVVNLSPKQFVKALQAPPTTGTTHQLKSLHTSLLLITRTNLSYQMVLALPLPEIVPCQFSYRPISVTYTYMYSLLVYVYALQSAYCHCTFVQDLTLMHLSGSTQQKSEQTQFSWGAYKR